MGHYVPMLLMSLFLAVGEKGSSSFAGFRLGLLHGVETSHPVGDPVNHDRHHPLVPGLTPIDVPEGVSPLFTDAVLLVLRTGNKPEVGPSVVHPVPVDMVNLEVVGGIKQEPVEQDVIVPDVPVGGQTPPALTGNQSHVPLVDLRVAYNHPPPVGQFEHGNTTRDRDSVGVVSLLVQRSKGLPPLPLAVVCPTQPLARGRVVTPIETALLTFVAGEQWGEFLPFPLLGVVPMAQPLGEQGVGTPIETANLHACLLGKQ